LHGLNSSFCFFDGSWVNFDGQTPFIRAALSGDIDVMRLLLQHGADSEHRDRAGLDCADGSVGINWIPAQTFTRSGG
jgi:ankyrin repeat protein